MIQYPVLVSTSGRQCLTSDLFGLSSLVARMCMSALCGDQKYSSNNKSIFCRIKGANSNTTSPVPRNNSNTTSPVPRNNPDIGDWELSKLVSKRGALVGQGQERRPLFLQQSSWFATSYRHVLNIYSNITARLSKHSSAYRSLHFLVFVFERNVQWLLRNPAIQHEVW